MKKNMFPTMDYVEPGTLLKTKQGCKVIFWSELEQQEEEELYDGFFLVANEGKLIHLETNIKGFIINDLEYSSEVSLLNSSVIYLERNGIRKTEHWTKVFKVMKP